MLSQSVNGAGLCECGSQAREMKMKTRASVDARLWGNGRVLLDANEVSWDGFNKVRQFWTFA